MALRLEQLQAGIAFERFGAQRKLMGGRFSICCIHKPDSRSPVDHITHVGGFGTKLWKLSVEEVIRRIESKDIDQEDFFVRVGQSEVDVYVVSPPGQPKFIKTERDSTKVDHLLGLPDCNDVI